MINWWLSYHDDHGIVMKLVIMRSWLSSWHHFGAILGSNWEDFGSILGSSRAQRSSWELSESCVRAGSRFSGFGPPLFEGFWRPPGRVFGNIFVSFLDIDFAIGFHLLLRWFFIDFHTFRTSKSEQIQWEVLQKSNFRLVSYRMCLGIDFGRILESGWRHFWVPIGLRKRLRKQVL